ncbi:spermatogenesis-associated protein 3-like [Culex quinquefasciatus]|uniref:spermatogenesis-associated protein 3-like n=1 Tax=Culex quinquefasciatus TaxID=7176 RepID=UPI0018E3E66E|nr:spermatogenesis-associated protein 3-like [Culex quinquefasciatus]
MKRGEPFPSSILKYMRTYIQRFGFSHLLFDIYSRIRSSTTTTAGFPQQPQRAADSDLQHNSSECNATPELSGPPAGMGPMHHKPPTHLHHPPPRPPTRTAADAPDANVPARSPLRTREPLCSLISSTPSSIFRTIRAPRK